ncbi:Tf2-8, partial [Mucuna pruriens]
MPLCWHSHIFMSFKLEYDASNVGVGAMLLQEENLIAFFNENVKGAQLNYSTYDKELYALVWALKSLKYLKGQHKLNKRHAKWMEFLEQFPYVIKYKKGKANIVADALSKRHALLAMLETKLLGFENFKDFVYRPIIVVLSQSMEVSFGTKAHEEGLMGHFGVHKTYEALNENFYWPKMRHDVHHICERCLVCRMAKSKASSNGMYTPLPIPIAP